MCQCKEAKGAPIWGTTCKCSHASVHMIDERFFNNSIIRSWRCGQANCDKSWEVKLNFDSQNQLEGKV